MTVPGSAAYGAFKGAIEVLTRYEAQEFGPRGHHRQCRRAPARSRPISAAAMVRDNPAVNKRVADSTALGRAGAPDDIGPMIASLLSGRQSLGHRPAHRSVGRHVALDPGGHGGTLPSSRFAPLRADACSTSAASIIASMSRINASRPTPLLESARQTVKSAGRGGDPDGSGLRGLAERFGEQRRHPGLDLGKKAVQFRHPVAVPHGAPQRRGARV